MKIHEEMEDERRTMKLLRQIVDSVRPMIQFEEDYPSNYIESKIQILVLKCWLDDETVAWHDHYDRPVATRQVLQIQSTAQLGGF